MMILRNDLSSNISSIYFPLKYINNKKKKGKPLNIESQNFPEKPVQLLVESAKN